MARTVDAAKRREWRERLKRFRKAGLSAAEFCRRERIAQASFYHWRRRLAAETVQASRPRFVELPAVAARLAELPAAGVQVALPGGAVVTLPGQASLDLVAAVVRAAMQVPGEGESC